MVQKLCSLLVVLYPFLLLNGQTKDTLSPTTPLPELRKWMQFDGVIKTKMEISTNDGLVRFNVRNSRMGVRGDLGDWVSYRMQVEFNSEGSLVPLDFYGILKPAKGLSVYLGQTLIPFDNLYMINPPDMMFANRAFIAKYFSPGARDIGMVVNYKFLLNSFPFEAQAGVFNGGKMNSPQWTEHPSYAFRLIAGSMERFRASAKIFRYQNEQLNQFLWGADLHYAHKRFRVEAEVMNRKNIPTKQNLTGAYIQGAWYYWLKKEGMFRHISPALRWDTMAYDVWNSGLEVNRITTGLNFGLSIKPFETVLRLDYEHYFVREGVYMTYFAGRDLHVADNKVTLELVIKF